MVIVRCVIPINSIFKTGLVEVKLSVDGGKNYPWWTKFYICEYFFPIFNINHFTALN